MENPTVPGSTVSATTFARNFARIKDEAIKDNVIVITSHDRIVGGYLSASELELYRKLKARERQALRIEDLSDDDVALIQNAKYGAEDR